MTKRTDSKIKCDCRYCKHAGPVMNFMVSCSIHNCKRSVGIRVCPYFEKGCSTK
nr:MAG TPA: nanos Nanos RNA binding domain [Caudoviricetes sp.]